MQTSDLIFTGFNKRVAALHRSTGDIIWEWKSPQGTSYVTLLLDRDLLIVSVDGYMYGLEALSGTERWANPMKGFGTGVASLTSVSGSAQGLAGAAAANAAAAAASQSAAQAAT